MTLNSVQSSAARVPTGTSHNNPFPPTLMTNCTYIIPKQTGIYLSESSPFFYEDLSHATASAVNMLLQPKLQVQSG